MGKYVEPLPPHGIGGKSFLALRAKVGFKLKHGKARLFVLQEEENTVAKKKRFKILVGNQYCLCQIWQNFSKNNLDHIVF